VSRTLKLDIPGPDRRVGFDEVREKGLAALFAGAVETPLPVVVEIGFGRGEFLLAQAAAAHDVAFLGLEVSYKRTLKMARRLARSELANVRVLEAPAEAVVADLLPPRSVRTFWVNFPDPWPKKRHHRRRLVQPPVVALLADRLVPGGLLEIATDHVDYAEQIDDVLRGEANLENVRAPSAFVREVPGRLVTAYEREWRAAGRPLHFFTYRRPTAQ
jgi:tRNA (guanine-N7-)-methyltransferase